MEAITHDSGTIPRVPDAINLLRRAAQSVPQHYFQLPVADSEEAVYRERVYAYELYHQFRTLMDSSGALPHFVLSGEVDKQGHPLLRPYKPDLVLHGPGDMDRNLLVVEIKSASARTQAIRKDLDTLEYFLSEAGRYQAGAYLVYGGRDSDLDRFRAELAARRGGSRRRLFLLWHQQPGSLPVVQSESENR